MKAGFTTLAKVLAICLTLSLLGGYVYWRAEENKKDRARLDALEEAQEKAMKTLRENLAKDQAEAEAILSEQQIKEIELFSSPKSGPVVMPSSKRMMVMPSSKSGMAIDFEKLLEENPELRKQLEEQAKLAEELEGQNENPAKDRVIMPSSKKAEPLFKPKQQQK